MYIVHKLSEGPDRLTQHRTWKSSFPGLRRTAISSGSSSFHPCRCSFFIRPNLIGVTPFPLPRALNAWLILKGCWKDYARPSPGGSRPARAERGMNLRRYFFTLLVVLPLSSPLSAQETDEDDKFFLGFAGSAVFPYDPNPLAGLGLARLMALCSKLEIPV